MNHETLPAQGPVDRKVRTQRDPAIAEARKLRKALEQLSDSVLMYLHAMDTKIGPNKAIPRDVSEWLGKACGALDLQNDLARQAAGMDFSAVGKDKARKRLMRSNAKVTGVPPHEHNKDQ